ncbi:MAG TPA: hypothetical protein PLJ71_11515, partial [Candidatus Hydrogenedentes bacterium]|nr:hypothetical protein [Candidatus Hydrogenedentota bacterium]
GSPGIVSAPFPNCHGFASPRQQRETYQPGLKGQDHAPSKHPALKARYISAHWLDILDVAHHGSRGGVELCGAHAPGMIGNHLLRVL